MTRRLLATYRSKCAIKVVFLLFIFVSLSDVVNILILLIKEKSKKKRKGEKKTNRPETHEIRSLFILVLLKNDV